MASTISAGTTSGTAIAIAGDTSGQLQLQTNGTTTAVTIDTSQNVGIGTTSPTTRLDVRSSQPTINAQATTNGNAGLLQLTALSSDGSNTCAVQVIGASIGNNSASSMIFKNDGGSGLTERMRIDSSGDLLVNTTGINASNLSGFVVRAYAGGIYTENGHNTSASSGDSYTIFRYNGTGIGSITQSGTTAVLYNTTSDYRLKTDVTPIQNALTTVEALNPVSFTWVDGRKDDGFLAHELQAIIPNCVTGEKDAVNEDSTPKYQQMDNSGVIPFLVKAIQELNAKVDAQATTITALQAKVGA